MVIKMNYTAFNATQQGLVHVKEKKECQDASLSYFDNKKKIALAVVCDGHGGRDYVRSAVGSELGCKIAKEKILDFVGKFSREALANNYDSLLCELEKSIVNTWREKVSCHCEKNPFTEQELSVLSEDSRTMYSKGMRIERAYGTTLIAVAVTSDFWFGIHIGDGKCVLLNKSEEFSQPIPWDDRCQGGKTTSMCDEDACKNFRHFYSEELPTAVFVGSDGIDDSFRYDKDLYHFYVVILSLFLLYCAEDAKNQIDEYLPELSENGSGDDVSVAAVFDMDLIANVKEVKKFIEEHKKNEDGNQQLQLRKAILDRLEQAEKKWGI